MDVIRVTSEKLHARADQLFTAHPELLTLPADDCQLGCWRAPNVNYAATNELENIMFLLDITYAELVANHTPAQVRR